jgi:hypothetical protein
MPLLIVASFALFLVGWIRHGIRLRARMSLMRNVLRSCSGEVSARGWAWHRSVPGLVVGRAELFGGQRPAQRGSAKGVYEGRPVTVAVLATNVPSGFLPWLIVRLSVGEYTGSLQLGCPGNSDQPHYEIQGQDAGDGSAFFGLAGEGLYSRLTGLGRPAVDVRNGQVTVVSMGEGCLQGDVAGRLDAALQVARALAGPGGT